MVDVRKYGKKAKAYPKMVKMAGLKLLRSKMEKELDMDLPPTHELHQKLNMSSVKARKADEDLKEITEAIERKATNEELEEIDARNAALDSLGELEFMLEQEKKEKADAIRVRKLEDEWDARMRAERVKPVTGEELQEYLDALDEYQQHLADEKAIKDASRESLVKKLRDLKSGLKRGDMTEEETEARIQDFVKSARARAKAVEKVEVKRRLKPRQ